MMKRQGMSLIELLVVIAIIGILVSLTLPAVQVARETSRRMTCSNNLKQLGLGMQAYHDALQTFPSGYIYNRGGVMPTTVPPPSTLRFDATPPTITIEPSDPGWGWAALSLPYLERQTLADAIDFRVSVQDPLSADVRVQQVEYLICASDTRSGIFMVLDENDNEMGEAATNSYVACFGFGGLINTHPENGNGVFQRNSGTRMADITDGTSSTLIIGERTGGFAQSPWAGVFSGGTVRTSVGARVYSAVTEKAPAMVLARIWRRNINSPYSEPYDFFSQHPNIAQFVYADGSVHSQSSTTDIKVLRALATMNGGEIDAK